MPVCQDDALAEAVDEAPAAQRRHQPHEREGRDHRAGGGVVDPELLGEDRERGRDHPEADGHAERDRREDQHLARQAGAEAEGGPPHRSP